MLLLSLSTQSQNPYPFTLIIDTPNCDGFTNGKVTIVAAGGTAPYMYSLNGGGYRFGNVFDTLNAGTYNATIRDLNLNDSTFSFTIGYKDTIQTSIVNIGDVDCFGGSDGSATVNVVTNYGPPDYAWSSGAVNQTANNLMAGWNYVTVINTEGCETVDSVFVNEPQPLSVSVAIDSLTCWYSFDGRLVASSIGGTGPYNYFWSNSIQTDTNSNLIGGAYSVTVSDKNGCIDVENVLLPTPVDVAVGIITYNNITCKDDSNGMLEIVGQGGTGPYTYLWNTGEDSTLLTNLTEGDYVYTITDAKGCLITDTLPIDNPDSFYVNVQYVDDTRCYTTSNGRILVQGQGGTPTYNYTLNGGPTQNNGFFPGLSAGNYTLEVSDYYGCSITIDTVVARPDLLTVTYDSFRNVICHGDSLIDVQGYINGGSPPFIISLNNGPTQSTGLFKNLAPGQHTVVITDFNSCTIRDTFDVVQGSPINVNPDITDVLCHGDNTGSYELNPLGGVAPYQYSLDGLSFNQPNDRFNLKTSTYRFYVRDRAGCEVYDSVFIDEPAPLVVTPDIREPLCHEDLNGKVRLVINGGVGPYYHRVVNSLGDTIQASTWYEDLEDGTYTFLVNDGNGCRNDEAFVIDQPDLITERNHSIRDATCVDNANGRILFRAKGGVLPFKYSINGSDFQNSVFFEDLLPGSYEILAVDSNNCEATFIYEVGAPDPVEVYVEPAISEVELGESIDLEVYHNVVGEVEYFWTPHAGLSCVDCENPTATVYKDRVFTIEVRDVSDPESPPCIGRARARINIIEDLGYYIPNAFTPNGDGNNDFFHVYADNVKSVDFVIFNRNGEMMFRTNNPSVGWDGMYKGVMQNPGVFIYNVVFTFLNDKTKKAQGSLNLIR